MNCDELATMLEQTLIYERDPAWIREARRHAEGCPTCATLLEMHDVEQNLTELSMVESSPRFLENVMSRISRSETVAIQSSRGIALEWLKYAAMFGGSLLLSVSYMFPAAGGTWMSNLWSTPAFFRTIGFSAYLSQHPVWAIQLAGLAGLIIVLGMAAPERPVRSSV